MYKSLGEFEFRSDPTTDYGVSCPYVSSKLMCTLFLWSFLNYQVSMTCIIFWMSSNFDQIRQPTTELAALELPITLIDL